MRASKFVWNFGFNLITYTFYVWLAYTIFFLFKDGWHWTAIDPLEATLDKIVSVIYKVGIGCLAGASVLYVNEKINEGQ